jgi:hypothetical protein
MLNRDQLHGLFLLLMGIILLGLVCSMSGYNEGILLTLMAAFLGAIGGGAIALGSWRLLRVRQRLYERERTKATRQASEINVRLKRLRKGLPL